jgi:prolyl oligopeptidase
LSIVYPKGMPLDGSHPTLLIGYGAYGARVNLPGFEAARLAWHEQGGVYAVCSVRGGGELGEEWHRAGKGVSKPNTWRDFIACAEYLVANRYTTPARLAGAGRSAGGILIGRAITERPDLFAAAIDTAGMSDMLRSERTPNGATNIPEFGTVTTAAGFKALLAMSPYHHIIDRTRYPAVLVETSSNDHVVEPWQMTKMAARLQGATISGKPVLLRVEYGSGHAATSSDTRYHQRLADEWSFLLWQFGLSGFQLGN